MSLLLVPSSLLIARCSHHLYGSNLLIKVKVYVTSAERSAGGRWALLVPYRRLELIAYVSGHTSRCGELLLEFSRHALLLLLLLRWGKQSRASLRIAYRVCLYIPLAPSGRVNTSGRLLIGSVRVSRRNPRRTDMAAAEANTVLALSAHTFTRPDVAAPTAPHTQGAPGCMPFAGMGSGWMLVVCLALCIGLVSAQHNHAHKYAKPPASLLTSPRHEEEHTEEDGHAHEPHVRVKRKVNTTGLREECRPDPRCKPCASFERVRRLLNVSALCLNLACPDGAVLPAHRLQTTADVLCGRQGGPRRLRGVR